MDQADAAAARAAKAALVELFEPEVSSAVWGVDGVGAEIGPEGVSEEVAALEPVEGAAVARAVDKRRVEFARGRVCARAALVAAGGGPVAIPVGANREPLFPPGFVGSLTHCDGFVAAVVARSAENGAATPLLGLGVDAERVTQLESGVLDMIVTDFDGDARGAADWGRPESGCLLFSAKESVFKAVFPLAGVWIGFEDVGLTVTDGSFEVSWTSETVDVPELARVEGRWAVVGDLVLTGCWLAP